MKRVYLDSAATTQLRDEVFNSITEVLKNEYGNPSSTHSYGRTSKSLLENARKEIASYLNVSAAEIIFTSGGTEADNFILASCVKNLGVTRIITSRIEHHAVLHTVNNLAEKYGITVDFVELDASGMVKYDHLRKLVLGSTKKTLVSLMHVNNEIGNILDIKRVAHLCKENDVLFHSDTVQSVGHFNLDFSEIPIDFAAVSAHKFHGPKGVGFAFVRKNAGLQPLILGGTQERGLRAGTEPVYAIVGMARALKISYANLEEERNYILGIKNYFKQEITSCIPGVSFNGCSGDNSKSTYTLVNACLPVSKEKALMLLFQLDLNGIACSKGSACQSGSTKGSHVLAELLSSEDLEKPSVRFSFSSFNTKEEVDYVIDVLSTFIQAN